MAKDLPKGTELTSLYNAKIIIDSKLGEGGQGYVYKISYNGEPKALKIYKPESLHNPKKFYHNLKNNISNGAPSPSFLWPTDMLRWNGTTFGYVMDLRPAEYVELVDLMNAKKDVRFSSFKAAVNAALEMAAAFQILHSKGYSYQDLSDGNFFVNPRTGKVLICDNDNVSEYGENTGILGTPQYMAPEIVRGEAKPSTFTDRFSLAVIIFICITMCHPLEGKRHLCEILTPANERIIYGTDPIFILDPADHRNAPVAGVHTNIGYVWPELPKYMKEMFLKQFSRDIMMNPQRRATEDDWLDVLLRFHADIIACPHCRGENFTYDTSNPLCSGCGKSLGIRNYFKVSGVDYPVPVYPGNVVFRKQLGPCNVDSAGGRVLLVRTHPKDPTMVVAQNVSGTELTVTKAGGQRVIMKPNAAMGIEKGTTVDAFGGKITIV